MRWAKDSWTSKCQEYDKFVHLTGSCFLTMLLYQIFHIWLVFFLSLTFAVEVAFLAGFILEVLQGKHEEYGDGFSWRDLVANVIGIAFAVWVIL
jgi:hypothetical protein